MALGLGIRFDAWLQPSHRDQTAAGVVCAVLVRPLGSNSSLGLGIVKLVSVTSRRGQL